MPVSPAMLAMFTMRPARRGAISRSASRVQKNVPFKWTASIRDQRSSDRRAVASSGVADERLARERRAERVGDLARRPRPEIVHRDARARARERERDLAPQPRA